MKYLLLFTLLLAGCGQTDDSTHHWQLDIYNPKSSQTQKITEADLAHKLLVINYWAEWCKPCITEIPELNRFAAAEQKRVVVISVNFDNKQNAALQEAAHKTGITFPIAITRPDSVFTLPDISGLPTTLVLDEHGALKAELLGPQTYDSLVAAIAKP